VKTYEILSPATTIGSFDGETAAHAIVAYHRAAGLRSVVGADGEVQHDPRDIESGAVVPSETAALRAVEVPYAGAEILVEVGRHTIDPQGLGSDDEVAACEEHILDAVRAAFPGATVRPVNRGGRTSGTTRDGVNLDDEVRAVVTQAFDGFEWPAGTTEADAPANRTITVAIDSDCALGGEPLIWGAAEGDDTDAAVANAREWIAEGGELSPASVQRRAEGLDVVTIQWTGKLPDGDNAAAIALALAALAA